MYTWFHAQLDQKICDGGSFILEVLKEIESIKISDWLISDHTYLLPQTIYQKNEILSGSLCLIGRMSNLRKLIRPENNWPVKSLIEKRSILKL